VIAVGKQVPLLTRRVTHTVKSCNVLLVRKEIIYRKGKKSIKLIFRSDEPFRYDDHIFFNDKLFYQVYDCDR
jgi:hypothetical protein